MADSLKKTIFKELTGSMKFIKEIFGRIFAIWGFIIFIPSLLIAYVLIGIAGLWKEPRRTIIFYNISRIWMQIFFFLTGIRIRIKGKEHFKKGETIHCSLQS